MAQEIEKKFLVKGDFKADVFKATRITQGYLCSVPERTVRIRVKGEKGFITVKGIGNASGAARFEWEKEIPVDEVKALLDLAEPGVIDKTRYLVKNTDGKHTRRWSSPTRTSPSTGPTGWERRSPATRSTSTPC